MGSRQGVGEVLEVPETTYGFTGRDAPGTVDVELTPVAPGRWTVTDARLPPGDPFRCMAFVEQRGAVFEVVQPGPGSSQRWFESTEAALGFVLATGTRMAQQRLRDEAGWLR